MTKHVRDCVASISPDKDTLAVTSQTARSIALATPKATLYFNHYVGECKDLIFGISLVDCAVSRGLQDGQIPKIVDISVAEIESRGMDAEGIYRVSGFPLSSLSISLILGRRFPADTLIFKR